MWARYASLNGSMFDRPLLPCDFQSLARPVLRNSHSILPKVSQSPWFAGQKEERSFVTSVSRIMSGHRYRIVEDPMCVCRKDYGFLIKNSHYVNFHQDQRGSS
jgi:hypothetical protein